MIPTATKVCLFSDKTNFHWKIIRPVEVDLFGAVRFAIGGKKELLKIKKMLSWFYQIKFVKMKAKVYFCKVGTGKHDRNEGKPVNEGDAPPPSNQ